MAFDSGGLFNSKSDSKTENKSTNQAFSDISGGASITALGGIDLKGKNSSATFNLLDGGAINRSFSFASDISAQAVGAIKSANSSNADTVAKAIQTVSESARSETENIFINLQKYALYGLMVWGVVLVAKNWRGS